MMNRNKTEMISVHESERYFQGMVKQTAVAIKRTTHDNINNDNDAHV